MLNQVLTTVVVALAVFVPAAGASSVIYVDVNADQTPHDGSDWHHAFLRLDEALAGPPSEAEIRVADGVYRPDSSGLADPREATFQLVSGTTLIGGFAGCGALDPNANDPGLYETVLSGDLGVPNQSADNCYHVLTGIGLDSTTTVENVTITAGRSDGPSAHRQGGGVMLSGGSPTFRGCIVRANEAEFGGGVFNSGGHPVFVATLFADNSAFGSGAAAYNYGVLSGAPPAFTACTFEDNTAEGYAGAMRNYDSLVEVADCEFVSNLARYGGGAVANGGMTTATFTRCLFEQNRADTLFAMHDAFGGAVLGAETSSTTVTSCAFHVNVANSIMPSLSYGGAVALTNSAALTVANCTLSGQQANLGAGIYGSGTSAATVANAILYNYGNEIVLEEAAAATVAYSAVTGWWPGPGNIGDDPLLAGLELQPGSPCINTGDPAYLLAAGDRDLAGHPRVLCGRVDMGALEFGLGDYDCSQSVDLGDFASWTDCLTGPGLGPYAAGCEAFDHEFDGDVDLADFAAFQQVFAGQ